MCPLCPFRSHLCLKILLRVGIKSAQANSYHQHLCLTRHEDSAVPAAWSVSTQRAGANSTRLLNTHPYLNALKFPLLLPPSFYFPRASGPWKPHWTSPSPSTCVPPYLGTHTTRHLRLLTSYLPEPCQTSSHISQPIFPGRHPLSFRELSSFQIRTSGSSQLWCTNHTSVRTLGSLHKTHKTSLCYPLQLQTFFLPNSPTRLRLHS